MLGTNIVRQFFTQILGLVSGFVVSIITARILGPEGRGDFALLLNTSNFLSLLLGFSFGTSIIHVISTNKMQYRSIVNTFTVLVVILIIVCSLFLIVFPFQKFHYFLPSHGQQNTRFYSIILISLFVISLFGTLFNSILSGKKLFWEQQKVYIAFTLLSMAAYLFLFFFKSELNVDLNFFFIFYSCITLILTLGGYFMYLRYARPIQTYSFLNWTELKYVLGFSSLAYFCNFFHFLALRMDFWLIEYFNGSRDLGLYSLPVNLAQMIWLLPQAIATILLAYSGSQKHEKGVQNTNTLARIGMALVIFASIFLFFTVDFFIPFLFGQEYLQSVYIFKLLLIGIIPFSITTILSSYFGGTGQMKVNLFCSIIGFLVCLIFDLILIPRYGNIGAALATSVAYFSSTAFIIFVYLQKTRSKLIDLVLINKSDIKILKAKFNFTGNK